MNFDVSVSGKRVSVFSKETRVPEEQVVDERRIDHANIYESERIRFTSFHTIKVSYSHISITDYECIRQWQIQ